MIMTGFLRFRLMMMRPKIMHFMQRAAQDYLSATAIKLFKFSRGPLNVGRKTVAISGQRRHRDPEQIPQRPVQVHTPGGVIVINHQAVLQGGTPRLMGNIRVLRTFKRGNLIFHAFGEETEEIADQIRAGRVTLFGIECEETSFYLRQRIQLSIAAREFNDWATTVDASENRRARYLYRHAAIVYTHLHQNARSKASFYIQYQQDDSSEDFQIHRRPHSVFITVVLSSNPNIMEAEIWYIAHRISQTFMDFVDEYEIPDTVPWPVTGLTLIQQIPADHAAFSHAIHGGPISAKEMRILGKASPDPETSQKFKALYQRLDDLELQLTSPGSYKNCVAAAIICGKENICYETCKKPHKNSINARASLVMSKIKCIDYTIDEVCMLLTEYKQFEHSDIWFYNSALEVIGHKHGYDDKIGILVYGGHALAMIKKRKVSDASRFIEPREDKPRNLKAESQYKWGTYDIETTSDTVEAYMVGMYVDTYTSHTGLGCMQHFLHGLPECPALTLYAHNGGKFDIRFVVNAVRNQTIWVELKLQEHGSRILSYTIRNRFNRTVVNFRDSYPLLIGPLSKLGVSYGAEHAKIDGVNHKIITSETYKAEIKKQEIDVYLYHDVLCLYEVLVKFRKENSEIFGFDALRKFTRPSMARELFLRRFYDYEHFPLYTLTREHSKFVRRGYFGGLTMAWMVGVFTGDWLYLDYTSHYPWVMVECELPYGMAVWTDFTRLPDDFNGFVHCMVRGGRTNGPNLIRFKSTRGLIDPVFEEWTDVVLTSQIIRLALKYTSEGRMVYDFKFKGGLGFKMGKWMKGLASYLYNLKVNATDAVQREGAKQGVNSAYGYTAMKELVESLVLVRSNNDLIVEFLTGHVHEVQGNIARVTKFMDTPMRFVPAAAWITDTAYIKLFKQIMVVEDSNCRTAYGDTDSLITDIPRHLVDIRPKVLGYLGPECGPIKEIALVDPKFYAILLENGDEIVKLKGGTRKKFLSRVETDTNITFSNIDIAGTFQISYRDIRAVALGKSLTIQTFRFRCGKQGWMHAEVAMGIDMPSITFKRTTNKGRLIQGKVYPLFMKIVNGDQIFNR